eukprot:CAMPEP_0171540126 /NCGR_PEP_ID=MMETSP0960-20121227/1009_1 /TAXON_ID=87120 /ORGANISM="Aurantiochytrium limacinum, Strain ATCCMYA-1381" /LENGTH=1177 /DNA_ID=CAMNT_0012087263 /DNA_START=478 /DNA_END=4011 /DNA_ORIENTATION=+
MSLAALEQSSEPHLQYQRLGMNLNPDAYLSVAGRAHPHNIFVNPRLVQQTSNLQQIPNPNPLLPSAPSASSGSSSHQQSQQLQTSKPSDSSRRSSTASSSVGNNSSTNINNNNNNNNSNNSSSWDEAAQEPRSLSAGSSGNNENTSGGQSKKWRRSQRLQVAATPIDVTFQHMETRKHLRRIWGTYRSDRAYAMWWAFLTLLLVFGVAGANLSNEGFWIKFNIGQLGFWGLITVIMVSIIVYTMTRILVVFRWMLYWLMLAEALSIMINKEYNLFGSKTPGWITICLIVCETLTLSIYLFIHFVYPRLLASNWFRKHIGAIRWWEVRMIGPWTLTYSSGLSHRYTCTYRGETNSDGLPHGLGHWMDDAYHGEILTGWWENGRPVGPFRSREFGSGYAFDTLVIGFVCATDDEFGSFKLFPTNKRPPRCGVASVECSISGEFFSHLPASRVLFGPFELDSKSPTNNDSMDPLEAARSSRQSVWLEESPETGLRVSATVGDCLQRLKFLSSAHPVTSVLITTNQSRGVSVAGHTFADTGDTSATRVRQLVVDVIYPEDSNSSPYPNRTSTDGHQGFGEAPVPLAVHRELSDDLDTIDSQDGLLLDTDFLGVQTPSLRSSLGFAEHGLPGTQRATSLTADDDSQSDVEQDLLSSRAQGSIRRTQRSQATTDNLSDGEADSDGEEDNFVSTREERQLNPNVLSSRFSDVDSVEFDGSSFGLDTYTSMDQRQLLRAVQAQNKLLWSGGNEADETNHHGTALPNRFEEPNTQQSIPHLHVRDWRSSLEGHAEALIFIPGFNSSLRHSLERLGQFLAMGHFPAHIKPFVFNWPAGQVATYLWAIEKAADARTVEIFGEMLDGLRDAGIRDVHFLTHSMGVHALMGAFADKEDGSRSDVSWRFSLAPDFAAEQHGLNGAFETSEFNSSASSHGPGKDGKPLLRARTITLLNPDYPLASFVDHGFATIRCVCDHVTVIGNRKDGALFWSELGNGVMQTLKHYFGVDCYPSHLYAPLQRSGDDGPQYSAPKDPDSCCPSSCVCCFRSPDEDELIRSQGQDRLFSKQLAVGRSIFSLFAPCREHQRIVDHSSSLFLGRVRRAPRGKRKRRRQQLQRPWLDLDAIDTTWMDANVHKLRHNYFNLNPVLVEDLHELIVTGRRAAERSMLLHREGNIYSYCQAPAFIVNEN